MFCPEGYFTPKMLAEAFRKSLTREVVRNQIYDASGQLNVDCLPAHCDEVLEAASVLLMMHFVQGAAHQLRLCDAVTESLRRPDPWPVSLGDALPDRLPECVSDARRFTSATPTFLPFIDTELWVVDSGSVSLLGQQDARHSRIAKLFGRFDGWSE